MTASMGEGRRISFDIFEERLDLAEKFGLKYDLSQCIVFSIMGMISGGIFQDSRSSGFRYEWGMMCR